jgi:aryl-alcohol dehydrogenase-like predicted oxidoreductase
LTRKEYAWLREILTEENLSKSRALANVAADLGVTQAQLAIGWLLRLPQVTSVITGATSRKQVEDNLAAIDVPARLDGDVLKRIETILENRPG